MISIENRPDFRIRVWLPESCWMFVEARSWIHCFSSQCLVGRNVCTVLTLSHAKMRTGKCWIFPFTLSYVTEFRNFKRPEQIRTLRISAWNERWSLKIKLYSQLRTSSSSHFLWTQPLACVWRIWCTNQCLTTGAAVTEQYGCVLEYSIHKIHLFFQYFSWTTYWHNIFILSWLISNAVPRHYLN